jgi:hypothetical protein
MLIHNPTSPDSGKQDLSSDRTECGENLFSPTKLIRVHRIYSIGTVGTQRAAILLCKGGIFFLSRCSPVLVCSGPRMIFYDRNIRTPRFRSYEQVTGNWTLLVN